MSGTTGHRILIIDDNQAIHEDFRKILARQDSGTSRLTDMEAALFGAPSQPVSPVQFYLDFASQGAEALALVQRAQAEGRPYALAFVDGRMPPGWDGVETIRRLWLASPNVQVVLCTAYADYSWQEIQRELGQTDSLLILKKPFDNMEVLQLAHTLTRKWELAREIQGRLNRLAFYDSLTGLPNRLLFLERFAKTIENARQKEVKTALLYIDLDNFKRINDSLGHTIGDELLRVTAERLLNCLRATDTVARAMAARVGGDEFTVLLPELDKEECAAVVAQRIAEQLAIPMHLGEHQIIITPSIGIAIFPHDGENVEVLLKNADLAMYYSKRVGPNSFVYFQETMNATALKRLTLENHLRQAVDRDEFALHFQPQFDLRSGKISGLEALLRWTNWELGSVPPLEFISVAEENGLIVPIGHWVLRTACQQAKAWLDMGIQVPRMAVNVSMKQFYQPGFVDSVRAVLDETGLPSRVLEIEITEGMLEKNPSEVAATLTALRNMDISIAVDDFGNGYSSLSRLKQMPIDCLKIDRAFVCGIASSSRDQAIINAIVAMAKGLNLKVIAEGVETLGQVDYLQSLECHEVQGYLYSRPLSACLAESFLRQPPAAPRCFIPEH
jgi:diguanylate cyclase (GGDEF)-like protein